MPPGPKQKLEALLSNYGGCVEQLNDCCIDKLLEEGLHTESRLRLASQKNLEDIKLRIGDALEIYAAFHNSGCPRPPPQRAAEGQVAYRGAKLTIPPSTYTLQSLQAVIEKKWICLRFVEYEVHHDPDKLRLRDEQSWADLLARSRSTKLKLTIESEGKSFSDYKSNSPEDLRDLLETYLNVCVSAVDGTPEVRPDLFSSLQLDDKDVLPGNTTVGQLMDTTAAYLEARAEVKSTADCASEMNRRDFITPVLVAAIKLARGLGEKPSEIHFADDVALSSELEVIGRFAWGPMDYVILYRGLIILVAEAKGSNLHKAWAQLYMQISSIRDELARRVAGARGAAKKRDHWEALGLDELPTYAVLCTCDCFHIVRYNYNSGSNARADIAQSKPCRLVIEPGTPEDLQKTLRKLVAQLGGVIVAEMKAVNVALSEMPSLRQFSYGAGVRHAEEEDQEEDQEEDGAPPSNE